MSSIRASLHAKSSCSNRIKVSNTPQTCEIINKSRAGLIRIADIGVHTTIDRRKWRRKLDTSNHPSHVSPSIVVVQLYRVTVLVDTRCQVVDRNRVLSTCVSLKVLSKTGGVSRCVDLEFQNITCVFVGKLDIGRSRQGPSLQDPIDRVGLEPSNKLGLELKHLQVVPILVKRLSFSTKPPCID